MKSARVKDILEITNKYGLKGLEKYFEDPDLKVYPNTWASRIKKYLDEKSYITVKAEIELLTEKFNFYNVQEKDSRTGDN